MKTLSHNRQRPGALLLEVTISAAMLAAALVLIARMNVAIGSQHRLSNQRTFVSSALQNEMERLATLSGTERAALHEQTLPLDQAIAERLGDTVLTAEVKTPAEANDLQRVTLRLGWRPIAGGEPTALSLTAFFAMSMEDRD